MDNQIQTFITIKLSNKFLQFIKTKRETTAKIESKPNFLQTCSIDRVEG